MTSPVERDYHDAHLLTSTVPETLVEEFGYAEYEVRTRATDAITQLADGGVATQAAARQMVRLRTERSQRLAEANVRRAANRVLRQLNSST